MFEAIVGSKEKVEKHRGVVTAIYSMLMFLRNQQLSAFQRLLLLLCIRGRAEDTVKWPLLMLSKNAYPKNRFLCASSNLKMLLFFGLTGLVYLSLYTLYLLR